MKLIIKTSIKKFVYRNVRDWSSTTSNGNTVFTVRQFGEKSKYLRVPAESIYWVREK